MPLNVELVVCYKFYPTPDSTTISLGSLKHRSQLDKFLREILSKLKPTATLLQFADEVLQTESVKKPLLEFRIRNNSVLKSSPYLQNWRSYGWSARELFFVRLILEWGWCVILKRIQVSQRCALFSGGSVCDGYIFLRKRF